MLKAKIFSFGFIMNMLAVSPIKFYNTPSFGLYLESVRDEQDNIIYRKDTAVFRNDLDFDKLANFLDKKYESVNNVNVIAHACSDGEEAYSIVSVFDSILESRAGKFLPLKAKDIDAKSLERAKQGVFYMTLDEYEGGKYFLKDKFDDYFTLFSNYKTRSEQQRFSGANYKVSDNILDKINFEQGNILDDVNNIDFKNAVLFARNFWPYLSKGEIEYLAETLASRMDNSSTLVIGSYDRDFGIDKLLRSKGFVETEVHNVFELPKGIGNKEFHKIYDYQTSCTYY